MTRTNTLLLFALIVSIFSVEAFSQVANATPKAPAYAKVFSHLEDASGWGHCTAPCAGGRVASHWMAPFQTNPSLSGSSLQFAISGPPYSNALFWKKVGALDTAKNFIWNSDIYVDSASLTAQTLEFDLFQVVGGRKYMFGSQCNYARKVWQGWNEQTVRWVDTRVPCVKFAPNKWHHITWFMQRVSGTTYLKYVSITIDGLTYPVNMIQPSAGTNWGHTLGVQYQQDIGPTGTGFHEWVDNVTLAAW